MNRPTAIAIALWALFLSCSTETGSSGSTSVMNIPIILRADRILDGTGQTWRDREIVVQDGRIKDIVAVGQTVGGTVYELTGMTLLPGLIDTHVHLGWHFDRETDRLHNAESTDGPEEQVLYAAENAWKMLVSGVTTVQSLGGWEDLPLRDAIATGSLPGPRIITSLSSITEASGTPAQIRSRVDDLAEAGADVIKIFASASIRVGGSPTLSQEQLDAACGQARSHGLRTVVHAHGPESAQRAANAACSQIEHGALLDRETLEILSARGLYFDPHIHLIFENYFENQAQYLGIGNYTEQGFQQMREVVPTALSVFREALTVEDLNIVFGTDAVAGAHGNNWTEIAYRVREGGQDPMAAIVSATSLAAESLGLSDEVGTIAVGLAGDLIAVAGDPSANIGALEHVLFVMRNGNVYKHRPLSDR